MGDELYGTTYLGGATGGGVIYENGIFYATTVNGGRTYGASRCIGNGCGTLFAIDLQTAAHTIVHDFLGAYDKGPDGAFPTAPPIFVNNTLYGTAPYGGHDGNGVLYAVSASTGQTFIRAKFDASGGPGNPGHLSYFQARIYGPLDSSGSDGFGEIFELKP
jgi:outer membrane protein assembly factor BamB